MSELLKKGDDAEQHAREKMVGECDYISLTETKTITFLDISPTIISVVDDDAEAVKWVEGENTHSSQVVLIEYFYILMTF